MGTNDAYLTSLNTGGVTCNAGCCGMMVGETGVYTNYNFDTCTVSTGHTTADCSDSGGAVTSTTGGQCVGATAAGMSTSTKTTCDSGDASSASMMSPLPLIGATVLGVAFGI